MAITASCNWATVAGCCCLSGSSWLEEGHRGDYSGFTRRDDSGTANSVGGDPVDFGQAGDAKTRFLEAGC
ncbi:MAG: hypothetical protein KA130_11785, partial [Aeromonas sp.]|nr:hypothetical protein [Aeromonas sp.]